MSEPALDFGCAECRYMPNDTILELLMANKYPPPKLEINNKIECWLSVVVKSAEIFLKKVLWADKVVFSNSHRLRQTLNFKRIFFVCTV